MGAMQRRKGARFEVAVGKAFATVYPDAKRGIGQARSASEVPDVTGTPFWPECKRGAGSTADAALAQASEARKAGWGPPVAVVRRDKKRATATMYLDDFLLLLAGPDASEEQRERIRAAVRAAETDGRVAPGKKTP